MRVLIINSVSGIRSTGRIVKDIADSYISEGHECRIAFGREKAHPDCADISYRIGNGFNVRINALKTRLLDNEGFNAVNETKKFLKWADKYDPDILWLHNLHGYYINIKLLFDWIKSRPQMEVKWTLHDCWSFTGHCSHFTFVGCEQWKEECIKCCQKNEYPKSILKDNSNKNYINKKKAFCNVKRLSIIVPSFWLADRVKESFLNEYTVKVVHNKIDNDIFKPTQSDFRQKYSLQRKIIILGVASAWNDRKGLKDFIKLSNMLSDEYVVVLVGLTKKQIKSMPNSIIGIERTNSTNELAGIYSTSDIFLNLTYEDTYPTVNLEAQACGTPCITYNTGGSVESVLSENIIKVGDLSQVINQIERLCKKI